MSSSYFPLRWESTGDQWWYASPIEWAAANGHCDLVRELLYIDSNHFIKLTSLRRIHRLETVWDDEVQFNNVAESRSQVARNLFLESETNQGESSLIRGGYGGWLLYTAASAGDVSFVKELLQREPLLVFGEGEYGITDMFYAASRSKSSEVFRVLFDFSGLPRCVMNSHEEFEKQSGDAPNFKWEMMNRVVHAAARGGNLEILVELLQDCYDAAIYRDVNGSTILHSASGRGQIEVVKYLVTLFDIVTCTDNQGNTALHVAAFYGELAALKALILLNPSSVYLTNNSGDTILHTAVSGFQIPGFQRLDRHIELLKHLICAKYVKIRDIINVRNNDGKTALHFAVVGNFYSNLVEILMTAPSIDPNIQDVDGMTPLDFLRQQPQSLSSEVLIKYLISRGGIAKCHDYIARITSVSNLKMQGFGSRPGTTFRIPDSEILSYGGVEFFESSATLSSRSTNSIYSSNNSDDKKQSSVHNARRHLKSLLSWSLEKSMLSDGFIKADDEVSEDCNEKCKSTDDKELPAMTDHSSPPIKKKTSAGIMQGVMQAIPRISLSQSPCTSFSRPSMSLDGNEVAAAGCSFPTPFFSDATTDVAQKSASTSKRLFDQYLCFSAQDVIVDAHTQRSQKISVSSMA